MIHISTSPLVHYLGDACAWASAFLVGRWVYQHFPQRLEHLAKQTEPSYFIWLAIGGVLGAWLVGSLNTMKSATPTLSHSIAGALAGAIFAVELWKWRHKVAGSTGVAFVLPITIGIVVGRWGCLFSGLADGTFGIPTRVPWAVDLGDEVGRYPTPFDASGPSDCRHNAHRYRVIGRRRWTHGNSVCHSV
jgi:phosphatidylglycerol---prolipoprotein diacylglyceryl transferase